MISLEVLVQVLEQVDTSLPQCLHLALKLPSVSSGTSKCFKTVAADFLVVVGDMIQSTQIFNSTIPILIIDSKILFQVLIH